MITDNEKSILLSAYLDGQAISDDQLLELISDEKIMEKWDSYTKIRASLKNEPVNFADGLVAKVMENIQYEPTYNQEVRDAANDVVESTNSARNHLNRYSWRNWNLGQIVIAASVACICAIAPQLYNLKNEQLSFVEEVVTNDNSLSVLPVSNYNDSAVNTLNIATNSSTERQLSSSDVEILKQKKENEMKCLDALLNDHDMTKRMAGSGF